jgi:hypothetical protein
MCESNEGKDPRERPRRRWDNIKINIKELRCDGLDCIQLDKDRVRWRDLVKTVERF